MQPGLVVRQATSEDIPSICGINMILDRTLYQPAIMNWSRPDKITDRVTQGNFYVVGDPAVAAMSMYEEKQVHHIETLAVREDYQRQGLGRELVEHAIRVAKEQQGRCLVVSSACEFEAQHFYERMGFVNRGKVRRGMNQAWEFFMPLDDEKPKSI